MLLWLNPDTKLYSTCKFSQTHSPPNKSAALTFYSKWDAEQPQKHFSHWKSSVTGELCFTAVSMVLRIHWVKLSNSPVCGDKKSAFLSRSVRTESLRFQPAFPPNFENKSSITSSPVSAESLLLLWSSPEEHVCVCVCICLSMCVCAQSLGKRW